MSYRAFEDKNGFIKFFNSNDIEFEVVLTGLDSLKGSKKWGKQATDLQNRFLLAFDGLTTAAAALGTPADDLMDRFALAPEDQFIPCDTLTFRRIHNDCIVFFKEVSAAYAILMRDDRRELKGN